MLVVHEQARPIFEAAKKEARRVGLANQFAKQLNYLRTFAQHESGEPTVRVTLHTDFAPYSFSVIWERKNKTGEWVFWFNGGLIYHGPHDRGGDGGGPTFSVCLEPYHGWSIHT